MRNNNSRREIETQWLFDVLFCYVLQICTRFLSSFNLTFKQQTYRDSNIAIRKSSNDKSSNRKIFIKGGQGNPSFLSRLWIPPIDFHVTSVSKNVIQSRMTSTWPLTFSSNNGEKRRLEIRGKERTNDLPVNGVMSIANELYSKSLSGAYVCVSSFQYSDVHYWHAFLFSLSLSSLIFFSLFLTQGWGTLNV